MFNITNNISNAQTPGYKQSRVELSSLFPVYLEEAQAEAQYEIEDPYFKKRRSIEIGSGVQIEGISKDFSQGAIKLTGRELDIAIEGGGFFQYQMNDGSIAYSRTANLTKDASGNIINQSGFPLEPPIRIPPESTEVIIDQEGRLFARIRDEEIPQEVGQILLARIPNPGGMKTIGQNMYTATSLSGDPLVDVPGQGVMGELIQRAQERSNVDIIREMMEMVLAQKGIELLGKAMASGQAMMKAGMGINN